MKVFWFTGNIIENQYTTETWLMVNEPPYIACPELDLGKPVRTMV